MPNSFCIHAASLSQDQADDLWEDLIDSGIWDRGFFDVSAGGYIGVSIGRTHQSETPGCFRNNVITLGEYYGSK